MTSTTIKAKVDFAETYAGPLEPVRVVDGGRMMVRTTQRFIGGALALAALGLWFAPGSSWDSDVMLFKLVLSMMALLAGLGLMQSSATSIPPTAEIDTIRREVRLVRVAQDGKADVLQRCAFADLSYAEQKGSNVRLWNANYELLAEVVLTDRAALNGLIAGLRDAGKID